MTIPIIGMRALPLWAAVIPLATVNVCYLVAVGLEHVPACIPYFSGCTSVSSTGRIAPERFIFLAGMLPSVVILMFFWQRFAMFLTLCGQFGSRVVILPLLGIAAALAKYAGAPRHAANNIVAWNAFVVASAFYAVVARIWWHHGFSGHLDNKSSGRPTSPRK